MNKAIKYYQKVKQNYKMDGKSFENYKDVFDFAEDYHKTQTKKIMPTDEEILKFSKTFKQQVGDDILPQTIGEQLCLRFGAKWLKQLLNK